MFRPRFWLLLAAAAFISAGELFLPESIGGKDGRLPVLAIIIAVVLWLLCSMFDRLFPRSPREPGTAESILMMGMFILVITGFAGALCWKSAEEKRRFDPPPQEWGPPTSVEPGVVVRREEFTKQSGDSKETSYYVEYRYGPRGRRGLNREQVPEWLFRSLSDRQPLQVSVWWLTRPPWVHARFQPTQAAPPLEGIETLRGSIGLGFGVGLVIWCFIAVMILRANGACRLFRIGEWMVPHRSRRPAPDRGAGPYGGDDPSRGIYGPSEEDLRAARE